MNPRRSMGYFCGAALLAWAAGGCASAPPPDTAPDTRAEAADRAEEVRHLLHGTPGGAWASTYRPLPSRPTLIRGGTVMTAAGEEIEGGSVLLRDGEIVAVGVDLEAPEGAEVVDAHGRYVTPGFIDTHSHLGVYPSPSVNAHADGNEMTDPNTAEVWAEHSLWPQDPGFTRALAGGVTTAQLLPGSANLIGGRGVTVRTLPARTAQGMMFPDAPRGLKMACGENPKRVYGGRNRAPMTRMGNVAGYREAFVAAQRYRDEWDEWAENGDGDPPRRDLALESLAEVLRGEILVHNHCYRADEMAHMLELAREFGFRIRSFHHGVEAYKVRDLLARDTVAASVWTDWWGFKMEAFDTVNENLGLLSEAGVKAVLHSDSDLGIQILNQDAARAMHAARTAGIEVTRDEALRWITANPAWAVGLEDRIGTLEAGKVADVVIWSGDPFRVYSRADQVFMDGALVYDRFRPELRPVTDFELGILGDWPAAGTGADEAHAPARPPRASGIAAPDARVRATDVRAAQARDDGDVAIVGGEVHTVSGDVIPGGTVLILDGQISAVGPDVAVPEGVLRIDAPGKVVTPGLFDAGTQMGLVEVNLEARTRDGALDDGAVRAAFDVLDGVNPNSLAIPVKRLTGITTVLSTPSGGLISGQAAVLDLTGGSLGRMLVKPRAAMMARYGAAAAAQVGGARGGVSLHLREVLEDARFWRENREAFDRGAARPLASSRLDLEALQPVLAGEMPLVVEVDRASDILAVLRIAGEYDLRLVVSGGAEAWMVADSLAEAGVPVVLRPLTNLPGSFDRLGSRFDNAAALHRAGVTVGISTFTTHDRGTLSQEAGNAVRFGLPWEEALQAVTLTPARALGVADRYGSLEPGKMGNVVVWTGDPFELSSRAETVVIRGEVMPDVSRQRELLERYRTLDEEDRPPAYRPAARERGDQDL